MQHQRLRLARQMLCRSDSDSFCGHDPMAKNFDSKRKLKHGKETRRKVLEVLDHDKTFESYLRASAVPFLVVAKAAPYPRHPILPATHPSAKKDPFRTKSAAYRHRRFRNLAYRVPKSQAGNASALRNLACILSSATLIRGRYAGLAVKDRHVECSKSRID